MAKGRMEKGDRGRGRVEKIRGKERRREGSGDLVCPRCLCSFHIFIPAMKDMVCCFVIDAHVCVAGTILYAAVNVLCAAVTVQCLNSASLHLSACGVPFTT